jgi:PHD/YefM family antitoxin component YafN of YafNO toxin-antitoxin module
MTTYTVDTANNHLQEIINDTIDNSDTTIIASPKGSVVMIDQDEWNATLETLKLLKDKRALNALLEGHKARKDNKVKSKSTEEVFSDLQD